MRNCGSIYSTITPPTLSPIASTLSGGSTAATNIKYIKVYSAITISVYINIVHKKVINIVKDI